MYDLAASCSEASYCCLLWLAEIPGLSPTLLENLSNFFIQFCLFRSFFETACGIGIFFIYSAAEVDLFSI